MYASSKIVKVPNQKNKRIINDEFMDYWYIFTDIKLINTQYKQITFDKQIVVGNITC